MKRPFQVTVLGQQYTVKSEASPEEIREVEAFVGRQIDQVVAANRTVDTLNMAVLALLNVAGAYLQLSQEQERQNNEELENRLQSLLQRVEAACPETGR